MRAISGPTVSRFYHEGTRLRLEGKRRPMLVQVQSKRGRGPTSLLVAGFALRCHGERENASGNEWAMGV
jgi:hypothetical protein